MTKSADFCYNNMPTEDVIVFKDGLLGLEHLKKYILLSPQVDLPFSYLQSVEDENLAFVVINPFLYMPDYSFDIYDDVIDELEVTAPSDIFVLVVAVVPSDITKMTANFAAPILINVKNKKAKQVVLQDSKYEIRFSIFEIFKKLHSQGAGKC